jgi:predicted ArsR family transcriptional regulator
VTVLTHLRGRVAADADIGKTGVVKSAGEVPVETHAGPSTGDGRTREAVARLLMEQGPITAAAVAAALELSAPAVRRHLDALIADGEAAAREASPRRPRGRGRPARHYLLTDAGRARFGHGYDDLAVSALRYLAEHGGEAAVRGFARHRVQELIGPAAEQIAAAGSPEARTTALARVLSSRGYAAQARAAGSGEQHGVQLCQHHCPVAHVAAEFPVLCEAETEAFAEVLGTHVQRLATIARGDSACTTHVPQAEILTVGTSPESRRRSTTTTILGASPGATIPRGRQSV